MFDSVFILWAIAAALGFMLWRREPARFNDAIRAAIQNLVAILPRLCVALILAGFVAKLLPTEKIGELIGHDTGWRGIALATMFGGIMPAGPMIAFPVVIVLRAADAGFPQIVAFLTAWSVFAWHRVLIYEVVMLGWNFALVRIASSLALPFIAGGIAIGLSALTGFK